MSIVIVRFGKCSTDNITKFLSNIKDITFEIVEPTEVPKKEYDLIILSGGPHHIYDKDHHQLSSWIINSKTKVLCICYGMQLVANCFGGTVEKRDSLELGLIKVYEKRNKKIHEEVRWMNRYDKVSKLPKHFFLTGVTENGEIASFTDWKKWWCVQYHPESAKKPDYELLQFMLH